MIKKKTTGFKFFMQILGICIIFALVAEGLQSWILKDYSYFSNLLVSVFLCLICGVGHNIRVQDDDTGIKEERIIPVIGTRVVTTDDIDYVKGIPTQKQFEEHLIEQDIRPQNGESRRVSEFKGILYPPVKETEIIHEPNKAL